MMTRMANLRDAPCSLPQACLYAGQRRATLWLSKRTSVDGGRRRGSVNQCNYRIRWMQRPFRDGDAGVVGKVAETGGGPEVEAS